MGLAVGVSGQGAAEGVAGGAEHKSLVKRAFRRVCPQIFFKDETGSNKSVHLTFVTTYGIRRNENAGMVQSEVTLDDLFT